LFFALVIAGIALARQNLRRGRIDQLGAVRLAGAVGLLLFAAQMLDARHIARGEETFVIIGAISWALFAAAFSWLSYVALEPYVRRHWPHALIAWTRLLAGRWRDRRVGRDLLIGSLAGLTSAFLDRGGASLAAWRINGDVVWRLDLEALSSLAAAAATFLRTLAVAASYPIDLLFLLLLLRVFAPRTWMALPIAVAILIGLNFPPITDPLLQVPLIILSATVHGVALTWFGLLAGCAAMFVEVMATHVLVSLDLSQFFSNTMVLGLFMLATPAMVGFYGSTAGRAFFGQRFEVSPETRRVELGPKN
jgi:hypothetical protein